MALMSYFRDEDIFVMQTNTLFDTVVVPEDQHATLRVGRLWRQLFPYHHRHTVHPSRPHDSVVIHNNSVNYDVSQKHFYIYF